MKIVAFDVWRCKVCYYICRPKSGPKGTDQVKQSVLFLAVQANVAQLVEQLICNQPVGGSSPSIGSESRSKGRYPSGQRGQTVNLLSYDFVGSNPALPTILSEMGPCRFQARVYR